MWVRGQWCRSGNTLLAIPLFLLTVAWVMGQQHESINKQLVILFFWLIHGLQPWQQHRVCVRAHLCACVCMWCVCVLCIILYYFKGMYECVSVLVLCCITVLVLHHARHLECIWTSAIQIPFCQIN